MMFFFGPSSLTEFVPTDASTRPVMSSVKALIPLMMECSAAYGTGELAEYLTLCRCGQILAWNMGT